ncbi:hypothetical protein JST97_06610 [bacterium]|nr:hypothetical protein [bacterium]
MHDLALEQRLARLESNERRWKAALLASLAIWGLSCARAHAEAQPDECRSGRFVLVDSAGAERAMLELDKGQPVLRLVGSNRLVQVQLGVIADHEGSASLYMQSADQSSFVALAATSTRGCSGLEMGGALKRIRLNTNLPKSEPEMTFRNEQNQVTGEFPHRHSQTMRSLDEFKPRPLDDAR